MKRRNVDYKMDILNNNVRSMTKMKNDSSKIRKILSLQLENKIYSTNLF